MQDKHERQVQEARRKGETPPQKPSYAKRDRTMFSHCIFNLEDTDHGPRLHRHQAARARLGR